MSIDFTINIGNIVALVGFFITVITWGNNIKWEVHGIRENHANLERDVKELNTKMDKFTETYIATRLMESQLGNVAKNIIDIERRLVMLEQRPSNAHMRGLRNIES
jgi:hypothetical protein